MTTFFVDLWHDLRERRLWPVAVGLLAAIVAVPVLLFKPASDAAPDVAPAPHTNGANTLPVVAVDSGPVEGSKLEAFRQRNPFKPMKDLAEEQPASNAGSGSASTPGGSDSGSGSASGGASASSGSAGASGGSTGAPSGGAPSGGAPSGGSTAPSTKWFHYTANFSFTQSGEKAKTFENVGSFTLLPDESTPAIVFVGVDGDHKSAMFFVNDPGIVADGEGKCNAKGAACRFVTLKLDDSNNEESFTALDGSVSYDLKLLSIQREELGTGSEPAASDPPKSSKVVAGAGAGVAAATSSTQSLLPGVFAIGPSVAREGQ